jgi:DNA-binding IclR family transcriptional regulator
LSPKYQSAEKALGALELAHDLGELTVALLSDQPGWSTSDASRYLQFLADRGWLKRLGPGRYVMGRKLAHTLPEMHLK